MASEADPFAVSAILTSTVSAEQMAEYKAAFEAVDADHSGRIAAGEIQASARGLGHDVSDEEAKELIASVDVDSDGKLGFEEFCKLMERARKAGSGGEHLRFVKGKGVGTHSWSSEEKEAFAQHINYVLADDKYLAKAGVLPIDPASMQLFDVVGDGIVVCKLVNKIAPDTVDERALAFPKKNKALNVWERHGNANLALGAARAAGCKIINFHVEDMADCVARHSEILVLGMLWQLVKKQVTLNISLKTNPQIAKLKKDEESLGDLMKLKPEELLLRWFNYHLEKVGYDGAPIKNFGKDVADATRYAALLHSINATCIPASVPGDASGRASMVLEAAAGLGVPVFIKARDILAADKNLNLTFCAEVFNHCPGLDDVVVEAAELESLEKLLAEEEGAGNSREERVFAQWLNSLHLSKYISDVYDDLSDGVALLQAIDFVEPGRVDWKRVNKPKKDKPLIRFKRGENCKYAVQLGKDLGFSLVGVGGNDILDGNKKLILALLWQLMRHHVLVMLRELGGGKAVSEKQIRAWANETAEGAGSSIHIHSFKDAKLKDSRFLLHLVAAIDPRVVQWEIVKDCTDENDLKLNARYAVSVARKVGASIFLTWEDIVEANPKMVLTILASLMLCQHRKSGASSDEKK